MKEQKNIFQFLKKAFLSLAFICLFSSVAGAKSFLPSVIPADAGKRNNICTEFGSDKEDINKFSGKAKDKCKTLCSSGKCKHWRVFTGSDYFRQVFFNRSKLRIGPALQDIMSEKEFASAWIALSPQIKKNLQPVLDKLKKDLQAALKNRKSETTEMKEDVYLDCDQSKLFAFTCFITSEDKDDDLINDTINSLIDKAPITRTINDTLSKFSDKYKKCELDKIVDNPCWCTNSNLTKNMCLVGQKCGSDYQCHEGAEVKNQGAYSLPCCIMRQYQKDGKNMLNLSPPGDRKNCGKITRNCTAEEKALVCKKQPAVYKEACEESKTEIENINNACIVWHDTANKKYLLSSGQSVPDDLDYTKCTAERLKNLCNQEKFSSTAECKNYNTVDTSICSLGEVSVDGQKKYIYYNNGSESAVSEEEHKQKNTPSCSEATREIYCKGNKTYSSNTDICGGYLLEEVQTALYEQSIGECALHNIKKKYGYQDDGTVSRDSCYSCKILKVLTESFLTAASKVYYTTQDACVKILIMGFTIWLALFILKSLSQVTSLEPANMLDQILKMCFKIAIAYVAIVIGARALCNYLVAPFMLFGTNFASQLLSTTGNENLQGVFVTDGDEDIELSPEEAEKIEQNAEEIIKAQEKDGEKETEETPETSSLAEKLTLGFVNKAGDAADIVSEGKIKNSQGKPRPNVQKATQAWGDGACGKNTSGICFEDPYCGHGIVLSLRGYLKGVCGGNSSCESNLNFLGNSWAGALPNQINAKYHRCIVLNNKSAIRTDKESLGDTASFGSANVGTGYIVALPSVYANSGYHAAIMANGSSYYAFNAEHGKTFKPASKKSEDRIVNWADSKCIFEIILNEHPEIVQQLNMSEVDKNAKGSFSSGATVSSACQDYISQMGQQGMGMLYNQTGNDLAKAAQDAVLAGKKVYYIGDSRFVGMCNAVNNNQCGGNNKEKGKYPVINGEFGGKYWYAQVGAYQNLLSGALSLPIGPGDVVVIGLGANNLTASSYISEYKKFADKGAKVYVTSVTPVNEAKAVASGYKKIKNNLIKTFNDQIKAGANQGNYTYVDLGIQNSEITEKVTDDGLHYHAAVYRKIYGIMTTVSDNAVNADDGDNDGADPTQVNIDTSSIPTGEINVNPRSVAGVNVPERDGLGRPIQQSIRTEIANASAKYQINPYIIAAIINTESQYVIHAGNKSLAAQFGEGETLNNSCCKGLMQVHKTYFPSYGNKVATGNVNAGNANIYNVQHNIFAGTNIFNYQLNRYNNIEYALAAYNAGNAKAYKAGKAGKENRQYPGKVAEYYKNMTGGELFQAAARDVAEAMSGGNNPCGQSGFIPNTPLGTFKYEGPTDILSKSVIDSIINANLAIHQEVTKLQVIGNMVTCFSSNAGAWIIADNWWFTLKMTDIFTWLVGAIIWIAGFMLTIAVTYYLLDISFKIGFAIVALPVVIGLWPFNLTKGKISACLSIITKSAATFAFLAITVNYSMYLVNHVVNIGADGVTIETLLDAMEQANANPASYHTGYSDSKEDKDKADKERQEVVATQLSNVEYVKQYLALFSKYFILILFALIYSFKMIGGTIKSLVNKFFPDQITGDTNPMHSKLTAATKFAKDKAMKPVGLARDIATHQTGRGLKAAGGGIAKGAGKAVGGIGKAAKWASSKLGKK